jgi:hypothetical protein
MKVLRLQPLLLALLVVGATARPTAGQTIETYRAKHRLAADLVAIAEGALGSNGQVVLDTRTATLILNGTPQAVHKALALLKALDRPLRHVVVRYEMKEGSELDVLEAQVAWKASIGPVRIGTLGFPGKNGVRLSANATRVTRRGNLKASLKMLEGGSGMIRTGEAFPFIYEPYYGAGVLVPVESGFEVSASVLADDQVRLDVRPFAGRLKEDDTLQYTAAETSLTVTPGELVVFAEMSNDTTDQRVGLDGGGRRHLSNQQVLILSVDVEEP